MSAANDDKRPLRRTIRGGRPFFFADAAVDKVLNMVVTLGSEVWALRERLAAVEGLQIQRGQLGEGEVDRYEFTAEQESRLAADRKEFIEGLFRVLQEQVANAAARPAAPAAAVRTRAKAKSKARTAMAPKTKNGKKTAGRRPARARGARR
ncbi:MAG: hypothetical protein H7A18_04180 [Sinobacteraceae bacterium]|nr:hypothetical protein [Nevskiaceae bacterium]MCP5339754.1 hypothetical protein [Nevskiaceae bacterium]MCP5467538.1 hypothetical protein [Nevskiaceae bacterium]MCP5471265.1 hypothetical protein [Nevskiaceae bacterium]